MLRPYRLLAAIPHAPALMTTSLLARLHLPAISLVLTFLLVDWTGSYAAGGALAAALTIGQAVAGPLRGRAADRASPSKVLVITGCLWCLGFLLTALLASGVLPAGRWWLLLPVVFVTGLASPPTAQVGRAMWLRVADGPARQAAFAVESILGELVYVAGPMLAAFIVAAQGPLVAAVWCAVWAVLGPASFAVVLWRAGIRETASARVRQRSGSPAAVRGFVRMLGFGCLAMGALICVDLLLVGWARERGEPALAGILAALWGIGSLVGGLAVGAVTGRSRLWLRGVLVVLGLVALVPVLPPVAEPGSPWVVGAVLLIGGTTIAPLLTAANSRVGELAPEHRRAEAFGWYTSAATAGAAVAAPLSGALLDVAGPAAAAAAAAGFAVGAVCLVAHRSLRESLSAQSAEHTAAT